MSDPIYLVRHGQTDWNAEQRLQGQSETDLNATGRQQAAANGRLLSKLVGDATRFEFVASPMRRTRQTMEIIRGELGLAPEGYETEPRIVELSFGDWEGSTFPELDLKIPGSSSARDLDKWNYVPPGQGAESYAMLAERVRPWLFSLAGPTIAVSHGGIVRAAFHLLNGLDGGEASSMDIPQDRVALISNGRIDWISPR